MKLRVPIEGGGWCWLLTDVITQSAISNNVDLESFEATLDNFIAQSKSSSVTCRAWRGEALYMYKEAISTGTTTSDIKNKLPS